jgi:hypothetical protein
LNRAVSGSNDSAPTSAAMSAVDCKLVRANAKSVESMIPTTATPHRATSPATMGNKEPRSFIDSPM